MSSRITRLSYSFLTAALLNLAACGDDPEPAKFSSATEVQKLRAVSAGGSMDGQIGLFFGSILVGLPDDSACPTISRSGDTTTITGGCTDDSGDRFLGSITAKNVPGFIGGPEHDPSKPSVITFDGFGIDDVSDENDDMSMEGSVTLNTDQSFTANLTTDFGGVEVHSNATWRRSGELLAADAGGNIEVTGLGAADIKGSWSMSNENPAGALELHGADVLKADFGNLNANGCVPLTVDGTAAGELCNSSDE